jgi:hypothetical protein
MLVVGCGTATVPHGGAGQSGELAADRASPACDLPTDLAAPAPGQGLTGPAVTALTGGAATRGFSLDGGQFSVEPPDSREPHDSHATLTAYVPSCEGYDKLVNVVPGANLVQVLAYGQVAASCGPPRPVSVLRRVR